MVDLSEISVIRSWLNKVKCPDKQIIIASSQCMQSTKAI